MLCSNILRTLPKQLLARNFQVSATARYKEIYAEQKDDKTTIVGARIVDSPKKPYILKIPNGEKGKCPLCQLKLKIKHTDVLILSQYTDSKGEILPRSATHLCEDQYNLITELIFMAQYARLLPKPDSLDLNKPHLAYNTYYNENTINLRPEYVKRNLRFLNLKLNPLEKYRVKPKIGFYYGKKL